MEKTAPRVLHFGPYDGDEIETVVEMDPEYILWASANVPNSGISQAAINRARQLLDEPRNSWLDSDPDDDRRDLEYLGFDSGMAYDE